MSNNPAFLGEVSMETKAFRALFVGAGRWSFVGELDAASVPDARAMLQTADGDIALDCAGLTFVDAAGVNLLVELHRVRTCRGAKLVLVNPSPSLERLLKLCRLDGSLTVRSDGGI